MIKILDVRRNKEHVINKYILDNFGVEHVWSDTWFGRHVIGQDCEWLN